MVRSKGSPPVERAPVAVARRCLIAMHDSDDRGADKAGLHPDGAQVGAVVSASAAAYNWPGVRRACARLATRAGPLMTGGSTGPIARHSGRARTMRSIRTLALAGALGVAALVAGAAGAEELRLAHWVPPQHPLQPTGLVPWGQSIAAASDGRLTITIFPAQQLGAAADHYDMARDGIADITLRQSRLSGGALPDHRARRDPVLLHQRQRRLEGARCLVPRLCRAGDGRRQVLHGVRCTRPAPSTRRTS